MSTDRCYASQLGYQFGRGSPLPAEDAMRTALAGLDEPLLVDPCARALLTGLAVEQSSGGRRVAPGRLLLEPGEQLPGAQGEVLDDGGVELAGRAADGADRAHTSPSPVSSGPPA